jgi:hypothetical protein
MRSECATIFTLILRVARTFSTNAGSRAYCNFVQDYNISDLLLDTALQDDVMSKASTRGGIFAVNTQLFEKPKIHQHIRSPVAVGIGYPLVMVDVNSGLTRQVR